VNIRVKLDYSADKVELTITDDGCGFDPGQVMTGAGTHLGLRNLRSRARKIKGRLDITSQPSKGTAVHMTVPLMGRVEKTPSPAH
jgi:signal transduction histidine kinase